MIMHMYDLLGTLSRLLFAFISTITVLFMHISLYQGGIQKPVANKQMLSYRRVHSRNQFATNCFAAIYFLKYLFVTCIIGCGPLCKLRLKLGDFRQEHPGVNAEMKVDILPIVLHKHEEIDFTHSLFSNTLPILV